MGFVQNSLSVHRTSLLGSSSHVSPSQKPVNGVHSSSRRTRVGFHVRAETTQCESTHQDTHGRRQLLAISAVTACATLSHVNFISYAAEGKKGFLPVVDKKDGYSFFYPSGWQEVAIKGQDKAFKDIIEPLESVSVNMIETNKESVRDLGSPQEVAETLIKRVLAPSNQKTKLIAAVENDVDGQAYYTFEFVAKAPNFTRHALGTITIGNGKFYTLTTGANERRWNKVKDKLHAVVESFKIFGV